MKEENKRRLRMRREYDRGETLERKVKKEKEEKGKTSEKEVKMF